MEYTACFMNLLFLQNSFIELHTPTKPLPIHSSLLSTISDHENVSATWKHIPLQENTCQTKDPKVNRSGATQFANI